jgi:hypothetical protein
MLRVFDVECIGCGRTREEYLRDAPAGLFTMDCPTCQEPREHRRVFSLQGVYTWRTPDSPTKRGLPRVVIGES